MYRKRANSTLFLLGDHLLCSLEINPQTVLQMEDVSKALGTSQKNIDNLLRRHYIGFFTIKGGGSTIQLSDEIKMEDLQEHIDTLKSVSNQSKERLR